jgi:hypothetical protein
MPGRPALDLRGVVDGVVVATRCTSSSAGTALSILTRNFLNSIARWRRWSSLMTVPSAILKAANRLVMRYRRKSCARRSGMPGIIGSTGRDRPSAWIWLFSPTHSATASSGGLWYSPPTSTTFSTKNGPADSLKDSCRCGLRSNFFQIRPMVDFGPASRCAANWRHHFDTDLTATPSTYATPAFDIPRHTPG